jgi:hypothetical protein
MYVVRVKGPVGDEDGYIVMGHFSRPTWTFQPPPAIPLEKAERLLQFAATTCGGDTRLQEVSHDYLCAASGAAGPEHSSDGLNALLDAMKGMDFYNMTMEELDIIASGWVPGSLSSRLDLYLSCQQDQFSAKEVRAKLEEERSRRYSQEQRIHFGPRGGRYTIGTSGYRRYF